MCVYCFALGLMAYTSAVSGSILAFAGALTFVASDFTLAWDKFAEPVAAAWWQPKLIVMATYYSAQILITASVASAPLDSSDSTATISNAAPQKKKN